MNDGYWNLFWMTGMPAAWALSHGRSEVSPRRDETAPEGPAGPLAYGPNLSGNVPGGPERLY